ncbi:MAG: hypothetical protein IKL41_07440 [Clostridia bacterium]|nr:hypothetical protein [Clostridia bacterium]
MKKILCIILALVLGLSCSVSAFAQGSQPENPIVIVRGMDFGGLILDQGTENERPAMSVEAGPIVASVFKDLFMSIFKGSEACADMAIEIAGGIFAPLACDKNGDSIGNITVKEYPLAMSNYPEELANRFNIETGAEGAVVREAIERYGAENVYFVTYDWRLDPYDTAKKIDAAVNRALADSGADKVRIICCSLGGVMTQAYLDEYGYEKVENCIFLSSAIYGSYCSSDPYAGKVGIDVDILMTFLNDSLSNLKVLWTVLKALGLVDAVAGFANNLMNEHKEKVYAELMRSTFATWPGLWGMQQTADFDAAKKLMFSGVEEEYAGLISKLDKYQQYRLQRDEFLTKMQADGVGVMLVTSYGKPHIPAFEHSYVQSDAVLETELMSAGATVAPYGKTLGDDYVAADPTKLSPDRVVDASTCLFPDSTWFIRGASHVCCNYGSDVADMLFWLSEFDGQPTVKSNEKYPQFQYCDDAQNLYFFD